MSCYSYTLFTTGHLLIRGDKRPKSVYESVSTPDTVHLVYAELSSSSVSGLSSVGRH